MKYVEIDGKRYDVECCRECPFFEIEYTDEGHISDCRHPEGGRPAWFSKREYGKDCPLREVEIG